MAPCSASAPACSTWGSSVSERDDDLLRALPGLMRIAAGAWWRTAGWTVGSSMQAGSRVVRAAATGESPAEFFQQAGIELRDQIRRLLDLVEPEPQDADDLSEEDLLRAQGADLLRRSADVHLDETHHPAYERILSELAPDEGRILRLLTVDGAQPAVDVRTWRPLDVGSEMVAPGLSMIGAQAGCRYLDRVPAYLNNLNRLGLVWFSREPLADPLSYQVLEAQPEVLGALRQAGRGRTVRRSIHLTPFGLDFCRVCLPLDPGAPVREPEVP